jgi:phosphoribosyl-dephospho-CoA transferase
MNDPNLNGLAAGLIETWDAQGREGFLLTAPADAHIETRRAHDDATGVEYRFLWMPHRELRADTAELERRGILNPNRDDDVLYRDPRDPSGRHCFLCSANIRECHPLERLVEIDLAGRRYLAGANFAWIERDHFTIMSEEHVDQRYSRHSLEAMLELHARTAGTFRVLFNGQGAGATIPWHLHYQITTETLPIEDLRPDRADRYPTAVHVIPAGDVDAAHSVVTGWIDLDPEYHGVNVLIAGPTDDVTIYIIPRDQRRSHSTNKGLIGGFEVAGDFVYSEPGQRENFDRADVATAREALGQIRPELATA